MYRSVAKWIIASNVSPEHLACLVENISDDIQNIPAFDFSALQLSYGLVAFSAVARLTAMLMRCCSRSSAPGAARSAVSLSDSKVSAIAASTVTLQFDSPLRLGQCLCLFLTSFLTASGKDSLISFVLGFRSRVLLLEGLRALAKRLAMPDFVTAIVLPVNLSRVPPFRRFTVSSRCATAFLVPRSGVFHVRLALSVSRIAASPVGFGCFLFRLYLFGFLLLLGDDEVSAFKICSLSVCSFELPLSMSKTLSQ